jgi:hypothetical protein
MTYLISIRLPFERASAGVANAMVQIIAAVSKTNFVFMFAVPSDVVRA